jgi:hypothetical protein
MVNWVGFVEDTRGRKAFIIDDRFPKAKQIDPESLLGKRYRHFWVGTQELAVPVKGSNGRKVKNSRGYIETEDVYVAFDDFTDIKPKKLIEVRSNLYLISGYVESSVGEYEFTDMRGFIETAEYKQKIANRSLNRVKSNKVVQTSKNVVSGTVSAAWTIICGMIVLFFVFPQCF